ncbi:DUF3419 family protein [Patescibacteria group bacterium]
MNKKQKISYSQCWEDPDLVKNGLDLLPKDNLIIITSGGDNVLNLSLIGLNEIIAIDSNPLQNYLLELKMVAIKKFDYEDCVSFLGYKKDKDRWKKYLSFKKNLSPQAVIFWDKNKKLITQGVIHSGRLEKFIAVFDNLLLPLIHSKKSIKKLFSFDKIEDQKSFFNNHWQNKRWNFLFNLFFDRGLLSRFGRSKKMFNYCETKNVGKCFSDRLSIFFTNQLVRDNYFVRYLFTGKYYYPFYPDYLNKNNFQKLKLSIGCIKIFFGNVSDYIDNLDKEKIYKICLSDIFESFSDKETQKFFDKLAYNIKAGSRVCFWNNLVNRYPEEKGQLKYLKEYSDELYKQDKLFFYKKFFIYEIL